MLITDIFKYPIRYVISLNTVEEVDKLISIYFDSFSNLSKLHNLADSVVGLATYSFNKNECTNYVTTAVTLEDLFEHIASDSLYHNYLSLKDMDKIKLRRSYIISIKLDESLEEVVKISQLDWDLDQEVILFENGKFTETTPKQKSVLRFRNSCMINNLK